MLRWKLIPANNSSTTSPHTQTMSASSGFSRLFLFSPQSLTKVPFLNIESCMFLAARGLFYLPLQEQRSRYSYGNNKPIKFTLFFPRYIFFILGVTAVCSSTVLHRLFSCVKVVHHTHGPLYCLYAYYLPVIVLLKQNYLLLHGSLTRWEEKMTPVHKYMDKAETEETSCVLQCIEIKI